MNEIETEWLNRSLVNENLKQLVFFARTLFNQEINVEQFLVKTKALNERIRAHRTNCKTSIPWKRKM